MFMIMSHDSTKIDIDNSFVIVKYWYILHSIKFEFTLNIAFSF